MSEDINGVRRTQEQAVKLEAEVEKLKVKLNSFQQAMFEAGFVAAKLEATIAALSADLSEAVAVFVGLMELGDPDEATEEAVDRNIQFWARARALVQKHKVRP